MHMGLPKRDLDSKSMGSEYDPHKRQRISGPSKVLHVRALPPMCSEQELVSVCSLYGSVVKVLLLQGKNQAFVEMGTIDAAQAVLGHFSQGGLLRGKLIYMQFSGRQHITVASPQRGPASGYINMAGSFGGGFGGGMEDFSGYGTIQGGGGTSYGTSSTPDQPPNYILIVTIINARLAVTLDNIYEVFKPYGEVKKIITFVKAENFKALVQMGTVESAKQAKIHLEGKDMFQGCCTLRIGFSKLQDLNVKQNNAKSRDFTVLPYGTSVDSMGGIAALAGLGGTGSFNPYSQAAQPPYMMQGHLGMGVSGYPVMGGGDLHGYSGLDGHTTAGTPGSVLLVNNLPNGVTCDNLFILFGVYGDVQRVKILFQKRETALVQLASPAQAQQARQNLNDVKVLGAELKINTSKYADIQMPRGDQKDAEEDLTKDYSKSPIHRFSRHRGSRNLKNVYPPSQVLHLSNIADGTTEEELRTLFSTGAGAVKVQMFKNSRNMAFAAMPSLEEAVMGLIRLHNYKINDKYLRVSFSNKDPDAVENSDQPGASLTSDTPMEGYAGPSGPSGDAGEGAAAEDTEGGGDLPMSTSD